MALGTVVYVAAVWPKVRAVDWLEVSGLTLGLLIYSALFALCVSYTIWYVAVRRIGSARTSAYSNLIPVVAMASAVLFLGEPMEVRKVLGAAAVLAGVAFTRAGSEGTCRRRSDGTSGRVNGEAQKRHRAKFSTSALIPSSLDTSGVFHRARWTLPRPGSTLQSVCGARFSMNQP